MYGSTCKQCNHINNNEHITTQHNMPCIRRLLTRYNQVGRSGRKKLRRELRTIEHQLHVIALHIQVPLNWYIWTLSTGHAGGQYSCDPSRILLLLLLIMEEEISQPHSHQHRSHRHHRGEEYSEKMPKSNLIIIYTVTVCLCCFYL